MPELCPNRRFTAGQARSHGWFGNKNFLRTSEKVFITLLQPVDIHTVCSDLNTSGLLADRTIQYVPGKDTLPGLYCIVLNTSMCSSCLGLFILYIPGSTANSVDISRSSYNMKSLQPVSDDTISLTHGFPGVPGKIQYAVAAASTNFDIC